MNINENHPDYLSFIKKEISTLKFLENSPFIVSEFKDLSISAKNIYSKYQGQKDTILKKTTFEFHSNFLLEIEKIQRKIIVEAIVTPDFKLVSYYFAICTTHDDNTLLRKFHFDYAIPIRNQTPKPVYHIQYGGEQSPYLSAINVDVTNLYPWLSSPRLLTAPINLAIILDIIFLEFRSDVTSKLTSRSEWKDFIKNNENFLLKPFYTTMSSFINNHHSSSALLRDFYYGK